MSDKKIQEQQPNTWAANTPADFQHHPSNGSTYDQTMGSQISDFDLTNGGEVLTLEDAQQVLSEHPDLYNFDFEQAAQQYGAIPGIAPIEQQNMNVMQDHDMGFNGNRTELHNILHPSTPGYFGFETNDVGYDAQNNYYAVNGDAVHQNGYQPGGGGGGMPGDYGFDTAQTPYDINAVQTPYTVQTPYIQDDEMAVGVDNSMYANNDIMADANHFFAATDNATDLFDAATDLKSTEEPSSTAAKKSKRASRAKGKKPVVVVPDAGDNAEDANDDDYDEEAIESAPKKSSKRGKNGAATTPAKRARKTAGAKAAVGAKTPSRRKTAAKAVLSEKRIRKETNRTGKGKPIPKNLEDCDEADRTLVEMRDAGHKWEDITATYTRLSHPNTTSSPQHQLGTSTLPNRYERLKANFIIMREEDNALLFEAKRDVEADFQTKKWRLVAEMVAKRGGRKYEAVVLQRQFRKLMLKEGFVVRGVGVGDGDFVAGEGEGDAIREDEGEELEEDALMGDDDADDDLPY